MQGLRARLAHIFPNVSNRRQVRTIRSYCHRATGGGAVGSDEEFMNTPSRIGAPTGNPLLRTIWASACGPKRRPVRAMMPRPASQAGGPPDAVGPPRGGGAVPGGTDPGRAARAHRRLRPRGWTAQGQEYLFCQKSEEPLARRQLEDITHRRGQAASVPECLPHRFRHTYAGRLLRAGVDIRLVKELLGHVDIRSTVVYPEVTDAALSVAVLRLPCEL